MKLKFQRSARAIALSKRERKWFEVTSDAELVEQTNWTCGCKD